MKFFGKQAGGKQSGSQILDALKRSNIGEFKTAAQKLHDAGGGKMSILKREAVNSAPATKGEMDIADVVIAENIFESIHDEYGDGIFTYQLWDNNNKMVGEYHFAHGQIKEKKKRTKKADEDGSEDGKLPKGMQGLVVAALQQNTEIMKAAMERKENGFDAKDLVSMVSGSFDRAIELAKSFQPQGGQANEIGAFMEGFHLRGEIQPQLEREEPLTALFHSIMPFLGQVMAARSGRGQIDPGIIEQVQRALGQYQQTASAPASLSAPAQRSEAGHPPPPGASDRRAADPNAAAMGSPAPSGMSGLDNQDQVPGSPAAGSQDYFYERFVHPFRMDVADGQPDEELAYQIISMVQYARNRMADQPPPLMVDFLTAGTLMEYNAAFSKFCAAIPELSQLRQKQDDIRAALIELLTPQQAGQVTEPEVEDVQNADTADVGESEAEAGVEQQDHTVVEADATEVQHEDVPSPVQ